LIKSNEKWFRYDLVWEKSRKVGFLSANKQPLRKHEMVYIFRDNQKKGELVYNPQKVKLEKPDKRKRNIDKEKIPETYGNGNLPKESNYTDRHPDSVLEYEPQHEMVYLFRDNQKKGELVYNPQKVKLDNPYIDKRQGDNIKNVYNQTQKRSNNGVYTHKHPDNEMVYLFGNNDNDLELERNKELREYAKMIYKKIGKTKKQIYKDMGNQKLDHFFRFNSSQFAIPTKETYDEMIKFYKLDKVKQYEEIEEKWQLEEINTYNPQMNEGKPYKTNGKGKVGIYNVKRVDNDNKGTRHPDSVLEYEPQHEMVYLFRDNQKKGELVYNPQKTEGKPYIKKRKDENKTIYSKDLLKRTNAINNGTRHPDSVLEYEPQHEMVYLFRDNQKKGELVYNPQKEKLDKPRKENRIKYNGEAYGNGSMMNKKTYTDRHPDSVLEYEPQHEMVYVFGETNTNEEWNLPKERHTELKDYSKYILNNVDITDKKLKGIRFFKPDKKDFCLMRKNTYDKLIEKYHINHLENFKTFAELKEMWNKEKKEENTYNPQKTEGKPYKTKERDSGVYGGKIKGYENKDGTRHPDSVLEYKTILKYKNPTKSVHRTQKPVDLCEFLVKSYSNEGDIVMDFTCGSGTTGIACVNSNRKFIGVEKDAKIFHIAKSRIDEAMEKKSVINS
jgi:DNA modification methylase